MRLTRISLFSKRRWSLSAWTRCTRYVCRF